MHLEFRKCTGMIWCLSKFNRVPSPWPTFQHVKSEIVEPFFVFNIAGSPCLAAAVDKRLLAIKPPHSFTRLPRSLGTRGNWKASEWRHWLLFYCLPCTLGIFHPRYWSHLAKLVEGVHLLLREELTSSSIDRAGEDRHVISLQCYHIWL